MLEIREAVAADLPAITVLYNHYVETTPITFDIEPFTPETRRPWFDTFATSGRHRLLVALRDDVLQGYAGSHRLREKAAYDPSIETTIYVSTDAVGQGVGRELYAALFELLEGEDIHRIYAGITVPNDPSVALHRRFGFESIGVFREVGRKLGRFWDVEWFSREF